MYCGLATTANKVRWIVFGVLVLIFSALIIAWGVVFVKMRKAFDDCYESQGCWKSGDEWHEDLVTTYLILLASWIVALIAVPIPLYVMCCCAEKPSITFGVVQMATPATSTYKASPYAY